MPAYDYRCTRCDERFEVNRGMGENDAVLCPSCSSEAKRVFTPVGVAFKGSGFHNTDYRQKPAAEPTVSCPAKSDTSPKCEGCPSAS